LNRVKDELNVTVDCSARDERALPQTFVDYEENPREYLLSAVNTVLDVHTRVSDLYSVPHDQVTEQLRLTIEIIKERQESELINNTEYGLLHNISASQRIKPRTGPPTPDDLDELLAKVWKERGFFLLHPRAIAAFGRECTAGSSSSHAVHVWLYPLCWRVSEQRNWRGIESRGHRGSIRSSLRPNNTAPIRTGEHKCALPPRFITLTPRWMHL